MTSHFSPANPLGNPERPSNCQASQLYLSIIVRFEGHTFAMKVSSILGVSLAATVAAQTCLAPAAKFTPRMADGYTAKLIVSGLRSPRGLIFDTQGHLLVVEQGKGLTQVTVSQQSDGSVCAVSTKSLIASSAVSCRKKQDHRKEVDLLTVFSLTTVSSSRRVARHCSCQAQTRCLRTTTMLQLGTQPTRRPSSRA